MSNELTAFLNFPFEKKQTTTKVVEDDVVSLAMRWQLNWREYVNHLKEQGIDASSEIRMSLLRYGNPQPDVRVLDDLIDYQSSLRKTIADIIRERRVTPSVYGRFFNEANGVSTFLHLPEDLSSDISPENIGALKLRYTYDASTYRVILSAVIRDMIVDKTLFNLRMDDEGRFHMVEPVRERLAAAAAPSSKPMDRGDAPMARTRDNAPSQAASFLDAAAYEPSNGGSGAGQISLGLPGANSVVVPETLLSILAAAVSERLNIEGPAAPGAGRPEAEIEEAGAEADEPEAVEAPDELDELDEFDEFDEFDEIDDSPETPAEENGGDSGERREVTLEEHEAHFSGVSRHLRDGGGPDFICFPEIKGAEEMVEAERDDRYPGLDGAEASDGRGFPSQQKLDQNHESMVQDIINEISVISTVNMSGFTEKLRQITSMGEDIGVMVPVLTDYGGTENGGTRGSSAVSAYPFGRAELVADDRRYSGQNSFSAAAIESGLSDDFIIEEIIQGSGLDVHDDEEPLLLEEIVSECDEFDDEEISRPFVHEVPAERNRNSSTYEFLSVATKSVTEGVVLSEVDGPGQDDVGTILRPVEAAPVEQTRGRTRTESPEISVSGPKTESAAFAEMSGAVQTPEAAGPAGGAVSHVQLEAREAIILLADDLAETKAGEKGPDLGGQPASAAGIASVSGGGGQKASFDEDGDARLSLEAEEEIILLTDDQFEALSTASSPDPVGHPEPAREIAAGAVGDGLKASVAEVDEAGTVTEAGDEIILLLEEVLEDISVGYEDNIAGSAAADEGGEVILSDEPAVGGLQDVTARSAAAGADVPEADGSAETTLKSGGAVDERGLDSFEALPADFLEEARELTFRSAAARADVPEADSACETTLKSDGAVDEKGLDSFEALSAGGLEEARELSAEQVAEAAEGPGRPEAASVGEFGSDGDGRLEAGVDVGGSSAVAARGADERDSAVSAVGRPAPEETRNLTVKEMIIESIKKKYESFDASYFFRNPEDFDEYDRSEDGGGEIMKTEGEAVLAGADGSGGSLVGEGLAGDNQAAGWIDLLSVSVEGQRDERRRAAMEARGLGSSTEEEGPIILLNEAVDEGEASAEADDDEILELSDGHRLDPDELAAMAEAGSAEAMGTEEGGSAYGDGEPAEEYEAEYEGQMDYETEPADEAPRWVVPEPWPDGFRGSDEQAVEYRLATLECRIFKKRMSRSLLVPPNADIDWKALQKRRLRGL